MSLFVKKPVVTEGDPSPTSVAALKANLGELPATSAEANLSFTQRLTAELTHPAFYPMEVTGDVLHGPNTFGPTGPLNLLSKTLVLGASLCVAYMGRIKDTGALLDILANVTLLVSVIYIFMSWSHTAQGSFSAEKPIEISFLQKITWVFYVIAAPAELVIATSYVDLDIMDEDENVNVHMNTTVLSHAGMAALLLFEGMVINRIPIRALHGVIFATYMAIYFAGTMLQLFGDVMGDYQDDAIKAAEIFFLMTPLAFLAVYGLSFPFRRYSLTLDGMPEDDDDISAPYVVVTPEPEKEQAEKEQV